MRSSSELEYRGGRRGCGGLEQAGVWAGGHAGSDVVCVAGVLEQVGVGVERDGDAGVAEHAAEKELYIVPNAGHVDLYDKTDLIPFDKLEEFFTENLARMDAAKASRGGEAGAGLSLKRG